MNLNDLSDDISIEDNGPLAKIRLNRPAALNALSLEMIRLISAALRQWAENDRIKAVAFTSTSERAFCAGGDMKSVYQSGMAFRRGQAQEKVASVFFGEEYVMNSMIASYSKPVITLMPGITMGGAYGIAGPGDFRIACDNTAFAMPEVAIGFFPDVGSSYFLNKCPGETGLFLALTGNTIGPEDMVWAGLASHIIPFSERERLFDAIETCLDQASGLQSCHQAVRSALEEFGEQASGGWLREWRREIDRGFSGESIEEILATLQESEWGRRVAETMASRSPTSLKVVLEHVRAVRGLTYEQVLERDFSLAQHFIAGHDFYEGVRAVLIDKDKAARWEPAAIPDVNRDHVESYFTRASFRLDCHAT
ncbi:MAG: enoyl-CoA hydratase/isomerase family protein [Alphaproteobacteria bacterium]|nr:enoyl-CoA hydratase/isomerase family protein [Alphaproteobacteria bacterium]